MWTSIEAALDASITNVASTGFAQGPNPLGDLHAKLRTEGGSRVPVARHCLQARSLVRGGPAS